MSVSGDSKNKLQKLLKQVGLSALQRGRVDLQLVELAMMHSSYSVDNNYGSLHNNERLEFYGDSVLKLACSKYLYEKFPDEKEGVLSNYRSVLVSDAFLAKYSGEISLQEYVLVADRSDLKNERAFSTILACSFEAFLGALFICIGFAPVYKFLEKFFVKHIEYVEENILKLNAKATLQEYTQGQNKSLPCYILVDETGKAHAKTFSVDVLYNEEVVGHGKGKSKKEAEQAAAYDACVKLGVING